MELPVRCWRRIHLAKVRGPLCGLSPARVPVLRQRGAVGWDPDSVHLARPLEPPRLWTLVPVRPPAAPSPGAKGQALRCTPGFLQIVFEVQ